MAEPVSVSGSDSAQAPEQKLGSQNLSLDEKLKQKYESFWLYSESHPSRLGIHIALRGVFTGAFVSTLIGLPVLIYRKRSPLLPRLGRVGLYGAGISCAIHTVVATERTIRLPPEGVTDRSYRLAYNWGQTKWDIFAISGAVISGIALRRPFGGVLPAAAMGTVFGTTAWIADTALTLKKRKKNDKF